MYINDVHIIYYIGVVILSIVVGQLVDWANKRPSAAPSAPPPEPGRCRAAAAGRRRGPGRSFSAGPSPHPTGPPPGGSAPRSRPGPPCPAHRGAWGHR